MPEFWKKYNKKEKITIDKLIEVSEPYFTKNEFNGNPEEISEVIEKVKIPFLSRLKKKCLEIIYGLSMYLNVHLHPYTFSFM